MGIPVGCTVVSVVVSTETRDRLHAQAVGSKTSVSKMLSEWLEQGISAPLERSGKEQSVRAVKPDELFVSLPRDWQRRTGVKARDRVRVSYSDTALIVKIGA